MKLRDLSDLCQVILAHMDRVGDLSTFDHPSGLECVRKKLPSFVNNRWRMRKAAYVRRCSDSPNFDYFCNFLEEISDDLCSDFVVKQSPYSSESLKHKSVVLSTTPVEHNEVENNKYSSSVIIYKCSFHQSDSHDLTQCTTFVNLDYKVKKTTHCQL